MSYGLSKDGQRCLKVLHVLLMLKVQEIMQDFERSQETPCDLERSCMAIGDFLAS